MMKEKEPSEAENALASLDIESLVAPAPIRSKFLESRHIFEDHPVFIQILQMDKAYFVWVGTIAPVFEHAHFSVPSKLEGEAITTTIMGKSSNSDGESIAAKLIKKTGVPVMLSYNISATIPGVKEFVEKKIFEALKSNSAK